MAPFNRSAIVRYRRDGTDFSVKRTAVGNVDTILSLDLNSASDVTLKIAAEGKLLAMYFSSDFMSRISDTNGSPFLYIFFVYGLKTGFSVINFAVGCCLIPSALHNFCSLEQSIDPTDIP